MRTSHKLLEMAIIKLSALAVDIIGRLGGTVFQRNSAGLSMRAQPGIKRSAVVQQQLNKGNMTTVQAAYRSLSVADLTLWTNYAIFLNKKQKKNILKSLSGQAIFIYQNQLRSIASAFVSGITPVIIETPTIQIDPGIITVVSVVRNFDDLSILLDRAIDTDVEFLMIKMSRPLTASQQSSYNKMVLIPYIEDSSEEQVITVGYTTIYGRIPTAGEFVNVQITLGLKESNGFSPLYQQRLEVTT